MKHDVTEKALIANNDVFADIINGNRLFGEYRILSEDLESIPGDSSYKDLSGEVHGLSRDVLKRLKKTGVDILLIGIENQSGINNIMPVRDMGYAYTAYMKQIREIIAENKKVNNHAYTRVIHDDQRLKPVSPSPK